MNRFNFIARAALVAAGLTTLLRAAEPAATAPTTPAAPTPPPSPTIIECTGPTEIVSKTNESKFTLHDNVVVTATNMKLTCDFLEVIAHRAPDPKATFGKWQDFKSLNAVGHVRIIQGDREATGDRAVVLPGEDKVIIEDNVTIRTLDNRIVQTGAKATLYRGEMRAVIEAAPGERTRLVLPQLKDLSPGKDTGKKASPPAEPAPKVSLPK